MMYVVCHKDIHLPRKRENNILVNKLVSIIEQSGRDNIKGQKAYPFEESEFNVKMPAI